MRPMNTYDFDKTIFYPDSSVTFVRWYMRRHPFALLCWLPRMAVIGLAYLLKLIPKEKLKENIFSFVRRIDDIDAVLKVYWDEHESRIAPWYRAQHRPDDIVISASPQFVVKPMTDRLGIELIASPMDKRTGKMYGRNCHGEEKVRRFYAAHPGAVTEAFYSDSLSDTPMARIAQRAYLIIDKGQTPVPWPEEK